MKIDLHLHCGRVLDNYLRKGDVIVPTESVVDYFERHEITHACVCYTTRKEIEDLLLKAKNTTIYPIQWITDSTDKLYLDINKGVKLHSHRGFSSPLDKKPGLDYLEKEVQEILLSLPDGYIVQYHTQSVSHSLSTPRLSTIGQLAFKYPKLKHMIIHAGAFGLHTAYPTNRDSPHWYTFNNQAVFAEMLIKEATFLADRLSNIYCDSSIIFSRKHFKTRLVFDCSKSGFGTDFPFCRESIGSMKAQERLIRLEYGEDKVKEVHQRSLDWIEKKDVQLEISR